MRFKKLRLVVGIAMIIFVLVVGNIIVSGFMQNNSSSSQAGVPVNIIKSGQQAPSVTVQPASSNTQDLNAQAAQASPPVQPSQPQMMFQQINTRAS